MSECVTKQYKISRLHDKSHKVKRLGICVANLWIQYTTKWHSCHGRGDRVYILQALQIVSVVFFLSLLLLHFLSFAFRVDLYILLSHNSMTCIWNIALAIAYHTHSHIVIWWRINDTVTTIWENIVETTTTATMVQIILLVQLRNKDKKD